MRRRAVIAGCGAALLATAGCAPVHTRSDRLGLPSAQSSQCHQLSQRAQEAIDHHDYPRARADLELLVAEAPFSAEAHYRLGRVLQLQGFRAEAEAAYQRALKIDPEYIGALIGQGEIEAELGRPLDALKRFDAAIEIDPHQAEAHFAQGRVLEAIGRTDDALAAYFRSLEIDPTSAPIIFRIATIQLARRQPDQALARLDQVLELTPDDPEAHHQRGLAYLALNHPSQAIADLQFTARRLPNRPDVFYHLALALDADHKTGAALEAAEHALKLAPEYADARSLSQRLRR
jgi:tetratricopeptide (TPR) repeat protein